MRCSCCWLGGTLELLLLLLLARWGFLPLPLALLLLLLPVLRRRVQMGRGWDGSSKVERSLHQRADHAACGSHWVVREQGTCVGQ